MSTASKGFALITGADLFNRRAVSATLPGSTAVKEITCAIRVGDRT
ncbi:hypothetical protein SAMN05428997_106169 [Bosea sp. CRIB-10]|nr:hypothetical protein [Bosea sp. CRIB-10]SFC39457.1 hypothetical protein SAMN05428997_106169 [Bosea sp. CRIB-10]